MPSKRSARILSQVPEGDTSWMGFDFDASSYGQEKLDSMDLLELITEFYVDLTRRRELTFNARTMAGHEPILAVKSLAKQAPYRLMEGINSVLSHVPGFRHDREQPGDGTTTIDYVVSTGSGLEWVHRDPGALANGLNRYFGIDPNHLPWWMTHTLGGAAERMSGEISLDLREMAEEISTKEKRRYAPEGTAQKLKDIVLRGEARYSCIQDNRAALGQVLDLLTTDADPRIRKTASMLYNMYVSPMANSDNDLNREAKQLAAGVRKARDRGSGNLDEAYRKSTFRKITSGARNAVRSIAKVNPTYAAAAAGLAVVIAGSLGVGNYVQKRLSYEALNERTRYEYAMLPESGRTVAGIALPVAEAGQISSDIDYNFMLANSDKKLPWMLVWDYRQQKDDIVAKIRSSRENAGAVLAVYNDPGLDAALAALKQAGTELSGSFTYTSGWTRSHFSEICSGTGKDRICVPVPVCDEEEFSWKVDKLQGQRAYEALEAALAMPVASDGSALGSLAGLPVYDVSKMYENQVIGTYNGTVVSLQELEALMREFPGRWESTPDSYSYRGSCGAGYWDKQDWTDGISKRAANASGLLGIRQNVAAYIKALDDTDRLFTGEDLSAKEAFAAAWDPSIQMLGSMGYSPGKGHNTKGGIDQIALFWKIGSFVVLGGALGFGLYSYEEGRAGRRYDTYGNTRW